MFDAKVYRTSEAYRKANRERMNRAYADPVGREAHLERMRRYRSKAETKELEKSEDARARRKARWDAMTPGQRERARRASRKAQRKYMRDPGRRLSSRMSAAVRKRLGLRGASKGGRSWEALVGYTTEQLKARLEALFEPGMTWENHGEWHVDHVVPVRAFEFAGPEDEGFRRCWALDNLAPRWATNAVARAHGSSSMGNIEKGARFEAFTR